MKMDVKMGLLLLMFIAVSAATEGRREVMIQETKEWHNQMPEIIEQVTWKQTANLQLYADPLPQTSKIYAYAQPFITIGMYQTTQKFHRDLPTTPIFAYGTSAATATFPGPTIEALRYIPTYLTWENHLPLNHILPVDNTIAVAKPAHGGVPTVVHLHGGVISPLDDGHAFAWFTANYTDVGSTFSRYTYVYPNIQHAGNLLYHDHAVGLTRINLLAGLLGAYVIRDPLFEVKLNLPCGAKYDVHLVIADREFYTNGSIYMNPVGEIPSLHPSWSPEYFGDTITVNGKIWPYLNVQRRKYRFRVVNAGNARYYDLAFAANGGTKMYPFTVVASDSSYLNAPVTTSNVVLAIAEGFDIVFDFSKVAESEIELTNSAPWPYPTGQVPSGNIAKVMKFVIGSKAVPDPSTVPATLANYPAALPSEATVTRYLALDEFTNADGKVMHLLINGKRFGDPATETPKSGSTEVWNVINLTGDDHPLHLHLAHFQAVGMVEVLGGTTFTDCMKIYWDPLKCNLTTGASKPIPAYEKTWKNIVKLPPSYMTTVVVKFKLVESGSPYPFDATAAPGYVYHCHILDHEDNEMIRPLLLKP